MPPAFGFVFRIESKMHQRVVALARFHNHVAAFAAVAARRPPARNELLPPEREASVTAVAGFYPDCGFINEHSCWSPVVDRRPKLETKGEETPESRRAAAPLVSISG